MELSRRAAARIRDLRSPVLVADAAGEGRCHPIPGDRLAIGSQPGEGLALPDLAPLAALVQRDGRGFEVFALDESLPIEIDGRPVSAAPLPNGARLRIGGHDFLFVDPTADVLPSGLQLALWGTPDLPPDPMRHVASEDFDSVLIESFRQVPWVLLSALLHASIALVLWLFGDAPTIPEPTPAFEAEFADGEEAEIDDVEIEEEVPEETEIENVETEVPEVTEAELAETAEIAEIESDDPAAEEAPPGVAAGLAAGELGGGGGTPLTGPGAAKLRQAVGRLRASGLDIVFLLDATGSMDGEIAGAKRRIGEMIGLVEALGIQFRIGVVAFRDRGEQYVTIDQDLTALRYKAVAFLDRVEASGGGDTPEAVLDALEVGSRMKFSHRAKKVLVLVGDAPPKPDTIDKVLRTATIFQRRDGVVHTLYTETGGVSSSDTRRLFADIASAGGGSSMELKHDDQVIEDIIMLALETDDRGIVRRLLRDLEKGPRVEIARKMIRRGDGRAVLRQLSRKDVRSYVALELLRSSGDRAAQKGLLPAYLEVLARDDTPADTAWLATLLMRRAVGDIAADLGLRPEARRALAEFSPDLPKHRRERALAAIAKDLYDRGLILRDVLDR
ncbi:MAG: VWA domain-containing protein [Planctomycetota bacterium]